MIPIWNWIFSVGLAAIAFTAFVAFGISVGEILNAANWPLREGDFIAKSLGGGAMWVFVLSGFALLIPSLTHVYRAEGKSSSANRILWTLFLILFPFVTPYFYFGLVLRHRRVSK